MAKVKIPKRVAGVKVPKKVRRKAKKALKAVESPVVREFAAAALGAAVQAQSGRAARGAGPVRLAASRIDGDRIAEALRSAAAEGIRRFAQGFEEGLRDAAGNSGADKPRRRGSGGGEEDGP